jgi:hypothetical protein
MTLIIGSFAYAAAQSAAEPKLINRSYLNVTMGYTIIYLMVIFIITALVPMAIGEDSLLIDYFKKFNLIMSFLQTSLLVLLGIFFSKENK